MGKQLSICCVGDLILDEPGPIAPYFDDCREVLKAQDILIGHVETPHTTRNLPSCIDIQAPPSKPEHLEPLRAVGFDVATVAGNHLYDCGPYGVIDTVEKLKSWEFNQWAEVLILQRQKNRPILEKNRLKVGVLSYNATGPKLGWAMSRSRGLTMSVWRPAMFQRGICQGVRRKFIRSYGRRA